MKKPRLELNWIGKDDRQNLEPRILLEDPTKSYHANGRITENDIFDNSLIFGDNLLGLKSLESEYAGKIKCVFIDPPYNTGSAFAQYDDGLEHSLWLSLIRDRLEIIKRLMSDAGSLWITIDDNEAHYLKVLCDEIFGRGNFVATCVWEKDKGGRGDADISLSHDNILVYAKDRSIWGKNRNLMPRTETQLGRFKNPDNDPRGPWRQGDDGTAKSGTEKQRFPVVLPSGRTTTPPPGRFWAFSKETLATARAEGRAYFGADGDRLPIIKRYLTEVRDGVAPRTWWTGDDVGTNQQAKRDHLNKLLPDVEPFATPKPEGLLQRILHIASNAGDLVLDSFAGSGTTGAVAHKMGRRWIMIELGEHCHTHIIPRLKKVIDGEDPGGVTEATEWKGGGGFRYYKLASSLLAKDKWGNWVIQSDYNPAMLAEAVCKLMGFTYAPSEQSYWMHGYSSERDFIYVTTQSLTRDQLRAISEEVGDDRSLLVCCKAFNAKPEAFANLTIKKIPLAVLRKCEWGRDDYSLTVQNLPEAKAEPIGAQPKPSSKRRAVKPQADLFAEKE
ncbi:site-specific DNA-methyltransferase [Caballeronia sp. LZ029]|uniref:site-specific DNA-methyltransferase n=1 Tax=Caballeronia sp. LZ029 TaxID=3038564 RepID=UPI00286716EE|nr:site-specific DNA-methyltransferase [Caballeronia sp. LZ029]MDR5748916.1 site-specific DNA-methyltransferase [Caballeronia sp. LZ029]